MVNNYIWTNNCCGFTSISHFEMRHIIGNCKLRINQCHYQQMWVLNKFHLFFFHLMEHLSETDTNYCKWYLFTLLHLKLYFFLPTFKWKLFYSRIYLIHTDEVYLTYKTPSILWKLFLLFLFLYHFYCASVHNKL
jgi:hypothetical protein